MAIDFSDMPAAHWAAVGYVARLRRSRLQLNQGDLKRRGGPGPSTVGKIERGEQESFPLRTQHALETALGWSKGTVEEMLHVMEDPRHTWWGDPEAREAFLEELIVDHVPDWDDEVEASAPASRASELSDEELLAELTYRMKKYADEIERYSDVAPAAQKILSVVSPPVTVEEPSDEPRTTRDAMVALDDGSIAGEQESKNET